MVIVPDPVFPSPISTGHQTDTLICHWIVFRAYPTTYELEQKEAREGVWRPIFPLEADQDDRSALDVKTQEQGRKRSASTSADELPSKKRRMTQEGANQQRKQTLTCIDLFAGAGGVTLAAKIAGFKVTHAVDSDDNCCHTLRRNHPDLQVLNVDVTDIHIWGLRLYADYVHIRYVWSHHIFSNIQKC